MIVHELNLELGYEHDAIVRQGGAHAHQSSRWKVQSTFIQRRAPYRSCHRLRVFLEPLMFILSESTTYEQIIIPEGIRIPLALQIRPDGHLRLRTPPKEELAGTCIEPPDVVQHPPHPSVQQPAHLAKHRAQAGPRPLELSAIARYAERHLCGLHCGLQGRVERKKAQEVRVGAGIEDDETAGRCIVEFLSRRETRFNVRVDIYTCGVILPRTREFDGVGVSSRPAVSLEEVYFVLAELVEKLHML